MNNAKENMKKRWTNSVYLWKKPGRWWLKLIKIWDPSLADGVSL
jgi:hypothetical protein